MVPCCSGLKPLPEVIPPGGEAVVSAYLKAGRTAEGKRVSFSITTDDLVAPTRVFVLQASFVHEWEIQEPRSDPTTLLIGQGATRTYRLIARHRNGEGPVAPRHVAATVPLRVAQRLEAEETTPEGIHVSTRTVAVVLPPDAPIGVHHGSITANWPDGTRRSREIAWTVEPKIRPAPAMLLLKEETAPEVVRVTVRGQARPFRIVGLASTLLQGGPALPTAVGTTHPLSLSLDARRLASGGDPNIEIITDDLDQPRLTLGVVVMPRTGGER